MHSHAESQATHGHSAGHSHGPDRSASRKRLALVLGLAATYMVAEVIGGLVTHSLALLADAGHMLSDVAALGLTLFAIWIAQRPPTARQSYGFYRAEILAALVNAATLLTVSVFVFIEAYHRFREPPAVLGGPMMAIAVGGLVVNLLGLWILNAGKSESLNVRGAWLHVATDALGSVGAIVGGAAIYFAGWELADPIVSVLIGILVIYSSWALLKETLDVLMETVPAGIDPDRVREAITAVPGVYSVHDLHVWSITSGMVSLSVHVCLSDSHSHHAVLGNVRRQLHDRFGIAHSTIQCEPIGFEEHGTHA